MAEKWSWPGLDSFIGRLAGRPMCRLERPVSGRESDARNGATAIRSGSPEIGRPSIPPHHPPDHQGEELVTTDRAGCIVQRFSGASVGRWTRQEQPVKMSGTA